MDLFGEKHGLGLQKTWLYGFFRDAEGLTYGLERNFVGSNTSGLFLMTQDGDITRELNVHPDSGRSARRAAAHDGGQDPTLARPCLPEAAGRVLPRGRAAR
jgi:hypothetical protein